MSFTVGTATGSIPSPNASAHVKSLMTLQKRRRTNSPPVSPKETINRALQKKSRKNSTHKSFLSVTSSNLWSCLHYRYSSRNLILEEHEPACRGRPVRQSARADWHERAGLGKAGPRDACRASWTGGQGQIPGSVMTTSTGGPPARNWRRLS